jgi:hypothetical protein
MGSIALETCELSDVNTIGHNDGNPVGLDITSDIMINATSVRRGKKKKGEIDVIVVVEVLKEKHRPIISSFVFRLSSRTPSPSLSRPLVPSQSKLAQPFET